MPIPERGDLSKVADFEGSAGFRNLRLSPARRRFLHGRQTGADEIAFSHPQLAKQNGARFIAPQVFSFSLLALTS
jgi:hypothetical protein